MMLLCHGIELLRLLKSQDDDKHNVQFGVFLLLHEHANDALTCDYKTDE